MIVEQNISTNEDGDFKNNTQITKFLSDSDLIKRHWFQFFANGNTGCMFAAMVAKNPSAFGWQSDILNVDAIEISTALQSAIKNPDINTISLIFPSVKSRQALINLIEVLNEIEQIHVEFSTQYQSDLCLGYRLQIGSYTSWITGFGPFDFLPKTRQTPYTSITLRVKPKPVYEWVLKASKETELHLADMNVGVLKEISRKTFEQLWKISFKRVKMILGGSPDLKSAAKTTFNLPIINHLYGK